MIDNIVKFIVGFTFGVMIILVVHDFILMDKIDSIKQEITDLRQELSYD